MCQDMQLVVFALQINGSEIKYGVAIDRVQEIIRIVKATQIPQVADYVRGIINLRGRIIPVIDIKKKFGLGEADNSQSSRIIVFDMDENRSGIIVDEVSEVLKVPVEDIEEPGDTVDGIVSAYIRGVAKVDDELIIILDLDKVLEKH